MERVTTVLVLLIMREGTGTSYREVTFENPDPCALKGSSVEFKCSYRYNEGETVLQTRWYKGDIVRNIWTRFKLSDLPSYENRTEYLGDRKHNCSIAIHDVQESDTGHYYFRFDTENIGYRSKKSVQLSVTELSASTYPDRVREGDDLKLECRTSCQQPPSIIWFKDGRPLAKPVFQAQAEDSGNYSCAIEGQESDKSDPVTLIVQYAPLNVSIGMSHPGLIAEGSNVSLTCSATANPAADNYTWYKNSTSSMLQVGSGQVLSFPSVKVSHSGLYLCRVRNSVGEGNSMGVLLTVYGTDTTDNAPLNVSIEMSHPGLIAEGSNVSLTCSATANPAADNYTWYKNSTSSMLQVGSGQVLSLPSVKVSHSGLYLCRVRNSVGEGNSMGVLLTVYGTDTTDINHLILRVGFGVKVFIVLLLTMIIIWACKKMRVSPVDKRSTAMLMNMPTMSMGEKNVDISG